MHPPSFAASLVYAKLCLASVRQNPKTLQAVHHVVQCFQATDTAAKFTEDQGAHGNCNNMRPLKTRIMLQRHVSSLSSGTVNLG